MIEKELAKLTDHVPTFTPLPNEKVEIPFEIVFHSPEFITNRFPVRELHSFSLKMYL
jgi:hypothetical protein